jgi:hypothetical protein
MMIECLWANFESKESGAARDVAAAPVTADEGDPCLFD